MKTLVLKCGEVVNNDNLRGMNELRLKLVKTGDGSGKGYFGKVRDTDDGTTVLYKVVKGSANLFRFQNTEPVTDEIEVPGTGNAPYVQLVSDEAEISIVNLATKAEYIGIDNNSPFYAGTSNIPNIYIDMKELGENINPQHIHSTSAVFINGDVKYLSGCPYIFLFTTDIKGNLNSLKGQYERIYINGQSDTNTMEYNFSDMAEIDCNSIYMRKAGICTGGDMYTLLKAKSTLDLEVAFIRGQSFTCSYTSGDEIPTMEITKISLSSYLTYPTVADTAALLTLLKDGKNANKITLPESIRIVVNASDRTNATLTALVSDLASLGCTVTFN